MEIQKHLVDTIRETDANVWLYLLLSIIFIGVGNLCLNQTPSNYQIGFPTTAMGFAFFVFAFSIDNSKKSAKKMDQILEKLNDIQEDLKKKNEFDPGSDCKKNFPGE